MLENSILLVGIGTNKYKLNEIVEISDSKFVGKNFGVDSCFYKALKELKAFNKTNDVYMLNLDTWEDIKNQQDILEDLNFDYLIPLDLYIDDTYYDYLYQKQLTYSQLILLTLHKTITTMIITGKHAEEFENLDAFLNDNEERIKKAEYRFKNLRKHGVIYVANMINNMFYANVVLGAILSTTAYGTYPNSSNIGTPVFDIYYSDMENSRIVYFKDNQLTGITVENFVNFSSNPVLRLVPVYKIIKYFYFHRADLDKFVGKAYTEYRKLKIQEELFKFLDSLVNFIIYKYELISITTVQASNGSVDIIIRFDIWPFFTTEKYTIETKL